MEKLQKNNREIEQRFAHALKEIDSLKAKLGKTEKELETAQVQLASTRSELDQEKAGVEKLRADHAIELSGTVSRERWKAVREFISSEQFAKDVALLNQPILQVGFMRALDQVKGLGLPGFDLAAFKDYNPAAEKKQDWLFDGYRKGHALKDLVGRSDVGAEQEVIPLAEGEAPGRASGKESAA